MNVDDKLSRYKPSYSKNELATMLSDIEDYCADYFDSEREERDAVIKNLTSFIKGLKEMCES